MDTNMENMISKIANQCIEEVEYHIDKTIHWQLTDNNDENFKNPDLFELEFKIKTQLLFTLIKKMIK